MIDKAYHMYLAFQVHFHIMLSVICSLLTFKQVFPNPKNQDEYAIHQTSPRFQSSSHIALLLLLSLNYENSVFSRETFSI